ncbi:MAG: signal recognition particle protein [Pseudomonadota bacterium]
MLEFLQEKLTGALRSLSGKGALTEADVDAALRELRIALLEADVALPAIKHLLATVRTEAVGEKILKGINPGQLVVKCVYDGLVNLLGTPEPFALKGGSPQVVLMCGLQGGGKTTSSAKLAKWLMEKNKQSVMLASLDTYRPAAILQLTQLAERIGAPVLTSESQKPLERLKEALKQAKASGVQTLILDTAGRTVLDDALMDELKAIYKEAKPSATLLVADAQTGQAAVPVAEAFKAAVPLTGLILTRLDGDARGGAALSLRHMTGVPIYFVGLGEKPEQFEAFRPEGLAGRILGQGDVVALVEKVQAASNEAETAALEKKFLSGQGLNFNDLKKQLSMLNRLGGFSTMLDLMPGMGAIKGQLQEKLADGQAEKTLKHQLALIDSMTPQERKNPALLNGKRRLRIAKGAGREVAELNRLVKQLDQLNQMAKMMKGAGGLAGMAKMLGQMKR